MLTATEQNRHILIVEDDADTAEMVSIFLETAGYTTATADSGEIALNEITAQQPDLVLLDLGLPDMSGLDVLKQVRASSFLPLIVISGKTQERDKVVALEQGADDYMGKPFSQEELLARVMALLRRVGWTPIPDPKLNVRHLELDMARRQASIRGKRLQVTPVEYGILVTMMRNAGEVVSHDELLHAVWGEQYQGDYSVLRVNISRLRQKLEENPRHPSYVVTVPGQGYIMPLKRP
ncbi:MAG: response regulator transcription factor [Chloroflexi bacterium]|uniref:response regulator transcription factor n=1 Tax=Candidatus Flexifilum breve TaxID=3140694 RepID=UPI00313613FE|nr:response regulator transcription factor [Chloroflexota bacterium]MBK9750496.1 response regulator transcription factor [Chloroflexota bacterium]